MRSKCADWLVVQIMPDKVTMLMLAASNAFVLKQFDFVPDTAPALLDLLKQARQVFSIQPRRCIVCLDSEAMLLRSAAIAKNIKQNALHTWLNRAKDQLFAEAAADYQVGYYRLTSIPGCDQQQYLQYVFLQTQKLAALTNSVKQAGLQLMAIELDLFAQVQFLRRYLDQAQVNYLLVEPRCNRRWRISLVKQHLIESSRTVSANNLSAQLTSSTTACDYIICVADETVQAYFSHQSKVLMLDSILPENLPNKREIRENFSLFATAYHHQQLFSATRKWFKQTNAGASSGLCILNTSINKKFRLSLRIKIVCLLLVMSVLILVCFKHFANVENQMLASAKEHQAGFAVSSIQTKLRQLNQLTPKGLQLNQFEITPGEIKITGYGLNKHIIDYFTNKLAGLWHLTPNTKIVKPARKHWRFEVDYSLGQVHAR